jgi:hypothetical protein
MITATLPLTSPITVVILASLCAGRTVEDDQVTRDHLGELARDLGVAGVGRDDRKRVAEVEIADVLREQRNRRHVIDRDFEEPCTCPA